jgi:hypothetical protein
VVSDRAEISELSVALMNTARKDWMTLENLQTEMPLTEDFADPPLPLLFGMRRKERMTALPPLPSPCGSMTWQHRCLALPALGEAGSAYGRRAGVRLQHSRRSSIESSGCRRLLRVTRYEHAASPTLNTAETVIFCPAAIASGQDKAPVRICPANRPQGRTVAVTESEHPVERGSQTLGQLPIRRVGCWGTSPHN